MPIALTSASRKNSSVIFYNYNVWNNYQNLKIIMAIKRRLWLNGSYKLEPVYIPDKIKHSLPGSTFTPSIL